MVSEVGYIITSVYTDTLFYYAFFRCNFLSQWPTIQIFCDIFLSFDETMPRNGQKKLEVVWEERKHLKNAQMRIENL